MKTTEQKKLDKSEDITVRSKPLQKKKYDRVLILGGGGVKGAFQIGTIKSLMEKGIKWDLIIGVSVGALTGDLVGSFIKRRLKLKRGAPAPFLDQITFLIFAFLFAAILIIVPLEYVIILIPLTLGMHIVANAVGYLLGLKKVPY